MSHPSVAVVAFTAVCCGTGAVATVLFWLARAICRQREVAAGWQLPANATPEPESATTDRRWWLHCCLVAVGCCCGVAATLTVIIGDPGLTPVAIGLGGVGVGAVVARVALATTDLRRRIGHLTAAEARFRALVTESHDLTMVIDQEFLVRWQSSAGARQLGLLAPAVLGRPFPTLVHPLDSQRVTDWLVAAFARSPANPPVCEPDEPPLAARIRDGAGWWRSTEATITDQRSVPAVGAMVLHIRDVSDRPDDERSPHRRAWTDELTGLANRRKLLHAVAELRAAGGRHGAILLVELAGPRAGGTGPEISAGDAMLVEAARRLRATVAEDDLVARLDGERFGILVDAPSVTAYALATQIVRVLGDGHQPWRAVTPPSVSIGVALLQGDDDVEGVLRRAELARQRAVQMGRSRIEAFHESIETALVRRMAIEQALPGAAERGELDLVYQAVVELEHEQPVGVEALLRWRHPTLGSIPPDELLAAAEQVGAMDHIGDWVLRGACRQIARWRASGRNLWLSINISGYQLRGEWLAPALTAALESNRLPADQLVIELSEHSIPDPEPSLAARLGRLREIGVRIAIDNFGNCQSSLANLRRLPIDVIKADPALFNQASVTKRPKIPILQAVVEMGRLLSIEVIATGLETASQVNAVREAGCQFGQGHHLAAPEHAERVEAFLESHRAPLF